MVIFSNGNWCNKLYISFWQCRCNSEFSVFLMFELRFIILFLDICDLLDRVCRPRCWFVSDKRNLFSTLSKQSLKCQMLTLKCFYKDDKNDLVVASTRDHRARLLKYYPRPPYAPKSSNREYFAHYRHISNFFNRSSLSLYVYTRGILGCLLGFWPLSQNPARAMMIIFVISVEVTVSMK